MDKNLGFFNGAHKCAIALIGCTALAMGCTGKVKPEYEFKSATKGLVILSITLGNIQHPPITQFIDLRHRMEGADESVMIVPTFRVETGFLEELPSDFPDVFGAVLVYELEAGMHEVTQATYTQSAMLKSVKDYENELDRPTFRVTPGVATYIGNFDLKVEDATRRATVFGDSITDKSARDVPIFLSRFKNISADKVVISIMAPASPKRARPYVTK
jgi:hypothetical protein